MGGPVAVREFAPTLQSAEGPTPLPSCHEHPGSFVRRYRSHGPDGPGVYPQCVPRNGDRPHLLSWKESAAPSILPALAELSLSEMEVFEDAAAGLSVVASARRRSKGAETVKTQRRSILLKLGARNMAHAVALAISSRAVPAPR
jgi:DNA-binding CsgD family transcriptional regulator